MKKVSPAAPAGPGQVERRRQFRREDDVENHAIVDHAVQDAPLVRRVLKTWQVSMAVAALFTMLGGVSGAMGYRLTSPRNDADSLRARVDANARRIVSDRAFADSVLRIMEDIRRSMTEREDKHDLIQCQLLRRLAPDLRPDGCDK